MAAVIRTSLANDGVTISYSVLDGAGPAVVILHGWPGAAGNSFAPHMRLSPRKVVLIDQRGHGLSTRRPADTSRKAFVGDVVRVGDQSSDEALRPGTFIGTGGVNMTPALVWNLGYRLSPAAWGEG